MFICDFGVEDKFLGIIAQRFSRVFEFTAMDPLAITKFPDLFDELACPFDPSSFDSYMCEIHFLRMCKKFINETQNI